MKLTEYEPTKVGRALLAVMVACSFVVGASSVLYATTAADTEERADNAADSLAWVLGVVIGGVVYAVARPRLDTLIYVVTTWILLVLAVASVGGSL